MYKTLEYIKRKSNSVNLENVSNPVHPTILYKCQNERTHITQNFQRKS